MTCKLRNSLSIIYLEYHYFSLPKLHFFYLLLYFVLNIYKQLLASEVHIHLLHMYDTWFMLIINRTIVK